MRERLVCKHKRSQRVREQRQRAAHPSSPNSRNLLGPLHILPRVNRCSVSLLSVGCSVHREAVDCERVEGVRQPELELAEASLDIGAASLALRTGIVTCEYQVRGYLCCRHCVRLHKSSQSQGGLRFLSWSWIGYFPYEELISAA